MQRLSSRHLAGFALVLALVACGSPGVPTDVELRVLASEQEAWDGRLVHVEGTLRTFEEPRHYWVEDAELHRVELVPDDGLGLLVGRRVIVEGRFTFADDEGRRITIENLEPFGTPGTP